VQLSADLAARLHVAEKVVPRGRARPWSLQFVLMAQRIRHRHAQKILLVFLASAVFLVPGCAGPRGAATSMPSSSATSSPTAPSPLPDVPLIPNTRADQVVCREFAAEQAGSISVAQFNRWMVLPRHSNNIAGKLLNDLVDWFSSLSFEPQKTEGYVGRIVAECRSIGIRA